MPFPAAARRSAPGFSILPGFRKLTFFCGLGCVHLLAAAASAQPRIVFADRTNDVIWVARDADADGLIDGSDLVVWFDGSNAALTPGLETPASLAVRAGGLAMVGDAGSSRRAINLLLDRNHDGDALDAAESAQGANLFGASDISFGSPQGAAFDSRGHAHIANASNAAGHDAVYRLVDVDGDGLFLGAGEITEIVGAPAFGSSNGNEFNPFEIAFIGVTGYMRNAGAGFHGVYRFEDLDGSGRADDPGEFAGFWDSSIANNSGVLPSAGFALEVDRARPRSLYTLQVAGGVDQLVRLTDADASGAAHEPGEAVVAYANGESGFGAVDVLSLADGRVLLTESGGQVLMLTDLDADGAFTGPNEATMLLTGIEAIGTIRQIALLPCPGDWDRDLGVNSNDISAYLTDWLAAVSDGTVQADANADGTTNSADISIFLTGWLAGVQGGC